MLFLKHDNTHKSGIDFFLDLLRDLKMKKINP